MHDLTDVLRVTAGIVFIVMAFSVPLVYIVARHRRQRREMELHHAERMAAIERGMELPPLTHLACEGQSTSRSPRTALLPGLVWFFIGVAISASLVFVDQLDALVTGLIPTAIGLAYLIYYFVEERKKLSAQLSTLN